MITFGRARQHGKKVNIDRTNLNRFDANAGWCEVPVSFMLVVCWAGAKEKKSKGAQGVVVSVHTMVLFMMI
jgi:hypothetical protein